MKHSFDPPLTAFEEYSEDFRQNIKKKVLEVIDPYIDSAQAKILYTYMNRLPDEYDIYWWNREAFFFALRGRHGLFTNVVNSHFKGNDFSPTTVSALHELGKILEHPEIAVKRIMEE